MPRKNANVQQPVMFEKRFTVFVDMNGRRMPVIETGGWSNKHWNVRRRAVLCGECGKDKTGCEEARKLGVDLCSDFRCEAAKTVRRILRAERDDGSTKRYDRRANTRSQGGSRGVPVRPKKEAAKPRPVDRALRVAVEGAEGDGALARAFRRAAGRAA